MQRINDRLKECGLPVPEFKTVGIFSVVFQRHVKTDSSGKNREKTREKIIRLISNNSHITAAELSIVIELTVKGMEYHLNKLKSEKIIERIGSDKGGYWRIKQKPF